MITRGEIPAEVLYEMLLYMHMYHDHMCYMYIHSHMFFIGAEAYGASYFGQALGQIHYTNFQCGGSETSLNSCAKTLASTDNCTFTELAGVQCFEQGQCESAGHTDCCTGGCNAGGCFCDSACYTFGDCCDNIENTCPSEQ